MLATMQKLLFSCLVLVQSSVFSQTEQKDPVSIYFNKIGQQSGLYNGPVYQQYRQIITGGHPYFLHDTLTTGGVFYDDVFYPNVPLMLDEISDELVTTDQKRQYLIQLIKPKITSFSIGNHNFVNKNIYNNGSSYYEVLYSATTELLKKERKSLVRSNRSQLQNEMTVRSKTDYFVQIGEKYHEIKTEKTFLKLFEEDRKSVVEFLKSQQLNFRKEKEKYLIGALTFYDGLQ